MLLDQLRAEVRAADEAGFDAFFLPESHQTRAGGVVSPQLTGADYLALRVRRHGGPGHEAGLTWMWGINVWSGARAVLHHGSGITEAPPLASTRHRARPTAWRPSRGTALPARPGVTRREA